MVEAINKSGLGAVFVIDSERKLLGSVTDGDVRRALLAGHSLDSPLASVLNKNFVSIEDGRDSARTTAQGATRGLTEYPVLDSEGRLVSVEVHGERAAIQRNNTVVIMAGGEGRRLRPLTASTPKPLLHVAGEPILERIIKNLRDEGFHDIVLSINYLGEQIETHFRDGSDFGVSIRYLREDRALGTAGALSLLKEPISSPIVVMNGDLVVAASIGKMVDYHREKNASMTVGAKVLETTIPFGVISTNGLAIQGIEEKPTYRNLVNAGVYVLGREILESVSDIRFTDMPELILAHVGVGTVIAYPMHETWADLGSPDDFSRADELLNGT